MTKPGSPSFVPAAFDQARAEKAVRELLYAIGEDPDRHGLIDTPARVARAYQEMFAGLYSNPDDVLNTTFDEQHDELVLVKDIPMYSTCEHHLVPFHGRAHVVGSVSMSDTTCPGCGLVLPETWSSVDTRGYEATPECLELGGEVTAFGMLHPETLGRWHQTCVDAYAAQHTGPRMKPITLCFALNGLFLVIERRWSGIAAREAHAHLAKTVPHQSWPRLRKPDDVGSVTVLDVVLAADPEDQAVAIEKWGTSVWEAWSPVHDDIRRMTDRQLKGWRPGRH